MTSELATKTATELTVSQGLVNEWLAFSEKDGASQATLKTYKKGLEIFRDWIVETGVADVTPSDVLEFKASQAQQYSIQTVNVRLSAIRSFYRYMVLTGKLPFNPASEIKGVKRPKSRVHKRDALSSSETKAVLASCEDSTRDYAMVALMVYCGLRQVEIHRADISDISTLDDRLVLHVQGKGHTEKDDFVIIPRHLETAIRQWVKERKGLQGDNSLFCSFSKRSRGKRLSTRAIQELVKGLYHQAGVVGDRKTTHSLRHSAITSAIKNGATPLQVQSMARHQSYDTTLGYYHETNRINNPAEDLIAY